MRDGAGKSAANLSGECSRDGVGTMQEGQLIAQMTDMRQGIVNQKRLKVNLKKFEN